MNAFNYRIHDKRCGVRAKEFSCGAEVSEPMEAGRSSRAWMRGNPVQG
jgi:hypothetical protein